MSQSSHYQRLREEARTMSAWTQHKFLLLIVGAIVIALVIVSISLGLYNSSGAAQLDFSRPGLESVRSKVDYNGSTRPYSATGPLDEAALKEFSTRYDEQARRVQSVDGFSSQALSDQALDLEKVFE